MATKHDLILEYIESLPVGNRISVRSIAKELNVSEGTAYRAIKDAENVGLVSTIQRVGTIRIERKLKKHIERLTFGEVVRIIEGDVLGGAAGLDKVLNKFVIGAMTKHAMERYITPGSLMIVGNRAEVQKLALEDGAAVLITGGFNTTAEIAKLADDLEMPILRTSYDTFTVATMINRALSDQLIKKISCLSVISICQLKRLIICSRQIRFLIISVCQKKRSIRVFQSSTAIIV